MVTLSSCMVSSLGIISAPSGTGKSELIKALKKSNFPYVTRSSVSYTTRLKRSGEIHGEDYFFVSMKKFENMINNNMFLEYARIFNNYYGTKKSSIETMLKSGIHVILEIDWQGLKQIKSKLSNIYTIFILPPSKLELRRRLQFRGKDKNQIINNRMKNIETEVHHIFEYDFLIVNDKFEVTLTYLNAIILSEQLKIRYQQQEHQELINKLLL